MPDGAGAFAARLAGQKSDKATKPMPMSGKMRSVSAKKQLNNWPAIAWASLRAAMKRCAVDPSPAVGEPAKKNPCNASTTIVVSSIELADEADTIGGIVFNASGRVVAIRSKTACQPPC